MNLNLTQRLSLEQKLTPQQVLLSSLLQLPLLSLEQKLKTEMEVNPLLEEELLDEAEQEMEQKKEEDKDSDTEKEKEEETPEEIDWDEIVHDDSQFDYKPKKNEVEEFEKPEVHRQTMEEHLLEQLKFQKLNEVEQQIGEYIIYNLKDDGYLDEKLSMEVVSGIFGTEVEIVDKVLKQIQKLEPIGIASRNLKECLSVQLEEYQPTWIDELAYEIVTEYWDDFVNKRYEKLLDPLQTDLENIKEALEVIQRLNPKPGETLWDPRLNHIIPDFIIEKVDGEFIVTLNEWNLPPLKISPYYLNLLAKKKAVPKDARKYLKKKLESAKWFLTAIQQRRVTMMNVMNALVKFQKDFFEKGLEYLKPLIQKQIAEEIEMDISTVSRVVNGKYAQTEYGVFELKSFFSEGMQTDDGEEVSTRKIKLRIKDIIEQEYELNNKPFSDQGLVEILKKEGYPIARRTVAKYREQMDIPVARLRKKI
ncbi:MAG: RNA polymerase factor sigma-54 [Calditrichia bacterium]|nr:RNA polymerase factor sigma-54 [Calditrichia bacterium]